MINARFDHSRRPRGTHKSIASKVFGNLAEAGKNAYRRERDLAKLIALWPKELADTTPQGAFMILAKLKRALRAERRRGMAAHWSYDLNRHLALLGAYKGELAFIRSKLSVRRRDAPAGLPATPAVEETQT